MFVEGGITHLVDHAIHFMGVRAQPVYIAHVVARAGGLFSHLVGTDNDLNAVVLRQCWQQLFAVVGDTAALGRQGRYER